MPSRPTVVDDGRELWALADGRLLLPVGRLLIDGRADAPAVGLAVVPCGRLDDADAPGRPFTDAPERPDMLPADAPPLRVVAWFC